MAPAANAESVWLWLMSSERNQPFAMRHMEKCEEEGKRWEETAIEAVDGRLVSFYCVTGK